MSTPGRGLCPRAAAWFHCLPGGFPPPPEVSESEPEPEPEPIEPSVEAADTAAPPGEPTGPEVIIRRRKYRRRHNKVRPGQVGTDPTLHAKASYFGWLFTGKKRH